MRAPAGRETRPTSDRVREAIFSMLTSMDVIEGARVLDLFSGSGALGIEALSRGAEAVTFVDSDRSAIGVIEANLAVLDDAGARATLVRSDAISAAATMPRVDVTFADPPYRFGRWPDLLEALVERTSLLVAEGGTELGLPWAPGRRWETVKRKQYGGTVVVVAQPWMSESEALSGDPEGGM